MLVLYSFDLSASVCAIKKMQHSITKVLIQLNSPLLCKTKPVITVKIRPKRSELERFFVRSQLKKLERSVNNPIPLKTI